MYENIENAYFFIELRLTYYVQTRIQCLHMCVDIELEVPIMRIYGELEKGKNLGVRR
jgi:hypothetical protein